MINSRERDKTSSSSGILIDYASIVNKQHGRLLSVLSPAPKSTKGFVPGLILVVNEQKIIDELNHTPAGSKRVKFLDQPEFVNSIREHFFVMCNLKKNICVLSPDIGSILNNVMPSLTTGLDPTSTAWVGIPIKTPNFNHVADQFVKAGFAHPYVTTISPLYRDIEPSVALCRRIVPTVTGTNPTNPTTDDPIVTREKECKNPRIVWNKIKYAIDQYQSQDECCHLNARLSRAAVQFLSQASRMGYERDRKGRVQQKEITGELYVKDVQNENGKFVYEISIDQGSVASGEEENVDVVGTRYNFHSHPHEAYVRHSVEKAWPSSADYSGLLTLGANTIFHCVAAIEGVYIVSFTPYWGSRLENISEKFVADKYDIDHKRALTPEQYVAHVNSFLYKGHAIYDVKFFPWDKADTVFKVYYPYTGKGGSCIPSEKIMEHFKAVSTS